jgi:hypothetical protein
VTLCRERETNEYIERRLQACPLLTLDCFSAEEYQVEGRGSIPCSIRILPHDESQAACIEVEPFSQLPDVKLHEAAALLSFSVGIENTALPLLHL